MKTARPVAKPPPPVEKRPRCPRCGKRLIPDMTGAEYIRDSGTFNEETNKREGDRYTPASWTGEYKGYGHFCTLRCGTAYANAIIDARRARPSGRNSE